MPGNKIGGQKAAATNKERHGDDFYKRIGSLGGRNGHTGGFASNRELAREAGRKGGLKSRRTGVTTGQGKQKVYYDGTPKPEPEPKPERKPESSTHWISRIFGGKNV